MSQSTVKQTVLSFLALMLVIVAMGSTYYLGMMSQARIDAARGPNCVQVDTN